MGDGTDTPAESAHATGPEGPEGPASGSASVVVATFQSSRDGERMVASLGHSFRHQARSGDASALIATRNHDGSFKLVQSRVVTASGITAATTTFAAAILTGFMGLRSAFRGAKAVGHGARQRQSSVAQADERLAAALDQLGPHAACVLFHCTDDQTAHAVAARADERASHSSHYSRTEFLSMLDRLGDNYDWIRPAVAEPAARPSKKHRPTHEPHTSSS